MKGTLVFTIATLVVVSGCGSAVTSGVAVPSTASVLPSLASADPVSQRAASEISPCTDLASADIAALGQNPGTKQDTGVRGQVVERGCGWTGKDSLVDVHVTNASVAKYQSRPGQANVALRTVAGLPSISFQIPNDPEGCSLVSDISGGGLVVQFRIKGEHEAAVGTDSCTAAVRVMEQVAPILLKQK